MNERNTRKEESQGQSQTVSQRGESDLRANESERIDDACPGGTLVRDSSPTIRSTLQRTHQESRDVDRLRADRRMGSWKPREVRLRDEIRKYFKQRRQNQNTKGDINGDGNATT